MPRDRSNEIFLAHMPEDVASIFNEVQLSNANHNKNCVNLFKLHDQAREIYNITQGGGKKVTGERAFQKEILHGIFKTLPVKKGDVCADRVGRFVGAYLKHVNEKAHEDHLAWAEQGQVDIESDHYGIRFTERLLTELMPGFNAKDKTVRYRVLFVLSHMTKHLGALNLGVHERLKKGLAERTDDREPGIRSLSAVCIAQVYAKQDQENGEEDDEEEVEHPGRDILLDMLSREPSNEVRKTILNNIRLDRVSIPHVVMRARDADTNVRKTVYGQVLRKAIFKDVDGIAQPGPAHPTALSLEFMESIIKKGLRDREDGPRQAAASLVNEWVKAYERELPKPEPEMTYKAEVGVVSLLERFNIMERKDDDLEVVEILLESIFSSRKDITDGLDFGEDSWRHQGPENAIVSRVFIQFCEKRKNDAKLEEILPVNRELKEILGSYYDAVIEVYDLLYEDTKVPNREIQSREFILGEMLKIGKLLDYSDRFGAREMLQLMRYMLSEDRLPDHLLPLCLDVLREVVNNERDYILIIVEEIQDLLEPLVSSEAMDADDRDSILSRCLKMCNHSLERVTSTYEENSSLRGIMDQLVGPCLQHEDPDIKRDAVKCVGMCSLITKPSAGAGLAGCLFSITSQDTAPDTRVVLYQTLFDLLMRYGKAIFKLPTSFNPPVTLESLEKVLLQQLGEEEDLSTLTVLCEGLMKLILTDFISRPQVILINLFKVFVWPQTQDHAYLLQRLNYFFEMYSVSSPKHQRIMQEICLDVVKEVAIERAKLIEDEEIATSAQVCSAFGNWTNPLALEENLNANETKRTNTVAINYSIQLDLAQDILKSLFEKTAEDKLEKDDKKALYQLLLRLHLPPDVDGVTVGPIQLLIDKLKRCHPPTDGPSKTAFKKFEASFLERYATQLEAMSEEDYRKYEKLDDLFKFLEDIIPDDSDAEDVKPNLRGQKRRSRSAATGSGEEEDVSMRSKRPRYSTGTDDGQSTRNATPSTHIPKEEPIDLTLPDDQQTQPRTSGPPPPGVEVIEISSDEGDDPPPRPPPRPRPKPKPRYRGSRASTSTNVTGNETREEDLDAELSRLLSANASLSSLDNTRTSFAGTSNASVGTNMNTSYTGSANITKDSLFSTDSEEDEDEVNDIITGRR